MGSPEGERTRALFLPLFLLGVFPDLVRMKKTLLLLCFCCWAAASGLRAAAPPEDGYVRDVRVDRSGGSVRVFYYAYLPPEVRKLEDIALLVSLDGGKTFRRANGVWGDVRSIYASGEKLIFWRPERDSLAEGLPADAVFRVTCRPVEGNTRQYSFWAEYNYSRKAPLSLSVGKVRDWGYYVRYKSSGQWREPEGAASGSGIGPGPDGHYDLRRRRSYRMAVTGGMMVRVTRFLYLYGGLGYGKYGVEYTGKDAYSSRFSYLLSRSRGLEAEGGAVLRWRWLSLSAGYGGIAGKGFRDFNVGIGLFL